MIKLNEATPSGFDGAPTTGLYERLTAVHNFPMPTQSSLGSQDIVAFVATRDTNRAKAFYGDILGLRFVSEDRFAVVFDANGTMLRVTAVPDLTPATYTVLGWRVTDIAATVEELLQAGVRFERYGGMNQDSLGIWTSPSGARVVWFKDPDGNTLSVTEFLRQE